MHRSLDLVVDERTDEVAFRFCLQLCGKPSCALPAIGEGKQPSALRRQLRAGVTLHWLDAIQQDRRHVAENERRAEANGAKNVFLRANWPTVRTGTHTGMLFGTKRNGFVTAIADQPR